MDSSQLKELSQLINFCVDEALLMQGWLQSYHAERQQVETEVVRAKNWLAKQPNYLDFLQQLQTLLQQQNIGAFSQLLSYFVKDVLQKDKEIVFDLYTYRNLPALKIEAMNEGNREDIYDGNGGSITNIVSTGLRLITLSRLHHRKFIILDEPDCWLNPKSVPIFAKIIGELSAKLNIQTIIISHHDWSFFKDYGRVIQLTVDGQMLSSHIVHDNPVEKLPEDYIESINLKCFMSHYNTNFQLHPHLTCIIGDLDIGKSVLGVAVRAVAYNDSSDSYIMHHEDKANVTINLSTGYSIFWQRVRVTNTEQPQKVRYSLYLNGTELFTELEANIVPDFIKEQLNICTAEDIDVHISHQKQPVFLLSKDFTPAQRAKILSLGKESIIIQKMMENVKRKTRHYKQVERDGEKRFSKYSRLIEALESIPGTAKQAQKLQQDMQQLVGKHDKSEELFGLYKDLESNHTIASLGEVSSLVEYSDIHPIKELNSYVAQLITLTEFACIEQVSDLQEERFEFQSTSVIDNAVKQLEESLTIASIEPIEIAPWLEKEGFKELFRINNAIAMLTHAQTVSSMELIQPLESYKLHDVVELGKCIDALEQNLNAGKLSKVESVDTDLSLHPVHTLYPLITSLESALGELSALDSSRMELQDLQVSLESQLSDYFTQFGDNCPTCGQAVGVSHFHTEEGLQHDSN